MKLAEFVDELSDLDEHEKLEFLVELADELPPLSPERGTAPLPPSCRVQECQTAVYLWVDVNEGRLHVEADVPRNSPTVRGLVTLVVQGLEGASPMEVLQLPEDLLPRLGLQAALGMTRQQGLRGVMARIQREIRRLTSVPQ
ncbi:MAG: SufE family protein [Planctomycetaceae bacterium]|nr:SufE family protein [Planctomycetaceae bacterium]